MRCATLGLAFITVLAVGGCGGTPELMGVAPRTQSVINGDTTSEWPAVGALIIVYGDGGVSEYCSATLIATAWVLTAAHCVSGPSIPPAGESAFFVGASFDAGGTGYWTDAYYPNPDYDPDTVANDVALVHLAEPVDGVTPMALNTHVVSEGEAITTVGYGVYVSDGAGGGAGSGTKRKAETTIDAVAAEQYQFRVNAEHQLVCFGDSGGPDLVGTTIKAVAGVHSTVSNPNCQVSGISTRIDAYQSWIHNTMAGVSATNCDMAGGSCTNEACFFTLTPSEYRCLPTDGLEPGQACNPDSSTWTSLPCSDGAMCLSLNDGDACYALCHTTADCSGAEKCALVLADPEVGVCQRSCNVNGGDCADDFACSPVAADLDICVPSLSKTEGAACNPDNVTAAECRDGLACQPTGAAPHAGTCVPNCDCDVGPECTAACDCDPDCTTACSCDTDKMCQSACACDADCGTCACDADATCDAACACDADCAAPNDADDETCTCDATTACDPHCACDRECNYVTAGCNAGAANMLPLMVVALFALRRRDATHKKSATPPRQSR